MRAHGWLLGLGLGLALAAPAAAQRAVTWGSPVTKIQNRVVNMPKAGTTAYNSNVPIALPYVTSPEHTKLSLSSFLPTSVGHMTAKPTHGGSIFPTPSQMPNQNFLSNFQFRSGSP
jgi:hypothetical protein